MNKLFKGLMFLGGMAIFVGLMWSVWAREPFEYTPVRITWSGFVLLIVGMVGGLYTED